MKDSFLLVYYLLLTWQPPNRPWKLEADYIPQLLHPWDATDLVHLYLIMADLTAVFLGPDTDPHRARNNSFLETSGMAWFGKPLPQKLENLRSDPRPHLEAEGTVDVSIIPAWLPGDGRTIPEAADHLPWSTQQIHNKKTGAQTRWKVKDGPCSRDPFHTL